MISTYSRSSQLRASRQGFSLIEVAIALVIFVIGALAIIRIFPGALSVIGNNGDQQIATNLGRSVATRLKADNAVPTATFNLKSQPASAGALAGQIVWATSDTVNHTADWVDSGTAVSGIPRFTDSLPTPAEVSTDVHNSALSRYRAIQGEQTEVFDVTEPTGSSTDQYVLTQFPISVQTNGTAITPYAPAISQNIELLNVRTKPDGGLDFSRAAKATAPDTIIADTEFTPQSLLYVTYRYRDAANNEWGIRQEAVILPADATDPTKVDFGAVKVSPPTTGTGAVATNSVIAEIVDVRLKKFLKTGEFGPSGASDFEKVADARRGLVRVTGVAAGQTVAVDYVADWSVMLQDGTPLVTPDTAPAGSDNYRQLALGARFIEDRTDVGIYSLLLDPTDKKGYRSSFGENALTTVTDADKKLVQPTEDDLRDGRVTFIMPNSAARARVAYRTRDNWVQQLSVAADSYKPSVANSVEPWRDYAFGSGADDPYLYFHAGDAGKSLLVSYTYDDGAGNPIKVSARPLTISTDVYDASGIVDSGFSTTRVARLALLDQNNQILPQPSNATGTPKLVSIQAVSGTSVTVRTAYLNGSKYAQTLHTITRRDN